MNIVKFEADGQLPAYLANANLDINDTVVTGAAFPSMSIKGMKFTVVRDGSKTVLTKPDDPDEVAQSIGVVFLRANLNAKTFYLKKYSEGDSDRARPDCYSFDGIAPSDKSANPQAKKCAVCPHNQWGSRVDENDSGEAKKGKACNDNARIAISAPDKLDPMLLRVPPKSLKPLREMLKSVKARKVPYNAVVVKLGFDRNEPSPVLTFKPVGLLDDDGYQSANALYDDETVQSIVGINDIGHPEAEQAAAPSIGMDELDAALAAKEATRKAAAVSKPAPKPTPVDEDDLDDILPKAKAKPAPKVEPEDEPAPAPKPAAKAKPAPKEYSSDGDEVPDAPPPKTSSSSKLLSDLDDLLGSTDD